MKPTIWTNCYDKSLKGFITDQSFGHPAKYSLGLIERIFDHCLKQGYLKRGDVVGDCFGGVCIGGLVAAYRGLRWYGMELEERFCGWSAENIARHRSKLNAMGCPIPILVKGDSRKFHTMIEAVGAAHAMVSSPPYAETAPEAHGPGIDVAKNYETYRASGGGCSFEKFKASREKHQHGYGSESGQIGRLKSGAVDGVIASPPFAGTSGQGGGGINKNGYVPAEGRKWTGGKPDPVGSRTYQGQGGQREPGNIETLKEGTVAGVISSPPYADSAPEKFGPGIDVEKLWVRYRAQGGGLSLDGFKIHRDKHSQGYGTTDGQIARLKNGDVQAVVTSPPFEDSLSVRPSKQIIAGSGGRMGQSCKGEDNYGTTQGQIGNSKGETYWEAMDQVYHSCFEAIKPGGVIVLVVKDYCKGGKRVRLCDDTMKLLEHIGFTPLERIYAMLVSETVEAGLFGEERTKRQRKSFFRRLYEADIPEGDERRIDHEEVLICRRH